MPVIVFRMVASSLVTVWQWLAGIALIAGFAAMVLCYAICSLARNFPRTVDGVFGQLWRLKSPVSVRELVDGYPGRRSTTITR